MPAINVNDSVTKVRDLFMFEKYVIVNRQFIEHFHLYEFVSYSAFNADVSYANE